MTPGGMTAMWISGLKNSLLTWKPLLEEAEALSVKLALENVFDEKPEPLRRLLDEVNSPFLGYCLDAGHGNLFSEVPLEDWVGVLGPRLLEIHLHDNHGTRTSTSLWDRGISISRPLFLYGGEECPADLHHRGRTRSPCYSRA